jgi:2'-5' RNA ligase
VRCFIALELPEEAKSRLTDVTRILGGRYPEARWVRPESFHLTLAFLGEAEGTELDCARDAVQAAAGSGVFDLAFSGTELLPERGPARVLALAAGTGARECGEIHGRVNRALSLAARAAGLPPLNPEWPDGRSFRVHMTLARAGDRPFSRDLRVLGQAWEEIKALTQAPCRVSRCILYRSYLGPGGARYEPVLAADL